MAELPKLPSVGVLTALINPEWQGLTEELEQHSWEKQENIPEQYHKASIEVWEKSLNGERVRVFVGTIDDMGQAASSLETMAFLDKCSPQAAILCGIAGSLKPDDVKKGDVVVAKQVHWRSQNKVEDCSSCNGCLECDTCQSKFRYRMTTHDVPQLSTSGRKWLGKSVSSLSANLDLGKNALHFGELFTWDYVLSSQRRAAQVLSADISKALCVEMEAGGFLSAIRRFKDIRYDGAASEDMVPGIIVRGISDYATLKDKKPKDRMTASKHAGRVSIALAESILQPRGMALA